MSEPTEATGERIAKLIARSGLCSRREAETLVTQGRVEIDGRTLDSLGFRVPPGARVTVDGEPLPKLEPARLWRFHKGPGILTAARDPDGRTVIYDRLPETLPRVMPIGRLDMNSEGLLLLTNDGELKRRLELPATGWVRRYRVRVHGRIQPADLEKLAAGLTIDGIDYGPAQTRLDSQQGANAWLTVSLREGKNREVRRLFEHLGYVVNRLIRIAYGPFQLGNLARNAVEEVNGKVLAEQLGREIAGKLGLSASGGESVGRARAKPTERHTPPPGGRGKAPGKPRVAKPGAAKPGATKAGAAKKASATKPGGRPPADGKARDDKHGPDAKRARGEQRARTGSAGPRDKRPATGSKRGARDADRRR